MEQAGSRELGRSSRRGARPSPASRGGEEPKPQALLAEGCVSARPVLRSVSVVTEQTGSDKGNSRGEPGRLLGGAYVGWGEAAWLQGTLVRVHGCRDPQVPSSAGGTSCFLAPGNRNNYTKAKRRNRESLCWLCLCGGTCSEGAAGDGSFVASECSRAAGSVPLGGGFPETTAASPALQQHPEPLASVAVGWPLKRCAGEVPRWSGTGRTSPGRQPNGRDGAEL